MGAALVAVSLFTCTAVADEPGDELIGMVLELIQDPDKDLRAVGLDQIRGEAKGEAATKRFAEALPKLTPDGQVALLSALADRGDRAARQAVLDLLNSSKHEPVRVAAIKAIGPLGEPADIGVLLKALGSDAKAERAAARGSLVQVRGDDAAKMMLESMQSVGVPVRVALVEILAERRALETVPVLLERAAEDESVRPAALKAPSEMAGPEHVAGMLQILLREEEPREREAAERAIAQVCSRIADEENRAAPIVSAMNQISESQQSEVLPILGRVGGAAAIEIIEQGIASNDSVKHDHAFRGLCNWPDASVAPRLIELAKSEPHAEHRQMALAALIRVAPLPDKRSAEDRLALVKTVFDMTAKEEDRKLIIRRARAIRSVETLRFVLPFIDQPPYAEMACETVVELAHHRELRDAHKAEFHAALDRVLKASKDPTTLERADRYKKGQTWARPKPADG